MSKKVVAQVRLVLEAAKATPAPPVGPALGQRGVNLMEFCKKFNAVTADKAGLLIPVVVTVFDDRSFTFITKTPPASFLLKRAAKINSGSSEPKKKVAGRVTRQQIKEIAEQKMVDLNATDLAGAMKVIEGTARSMGLEVVD